MRAAIFATGTPVALATNGTVLDLEPKLESAIDSIHGLGELTESSIFSALVVANGQSILYEKYAGDFGPDNPHSIQSITKMTVNLMIGELVAQGKIDLEMKCSVM